MRVAYATRICPDSFTVPMHGRKAERAFHEPEGRARHSVRAAVWQCTNGAQGTDAPYRFMVPMHAETIRKRAFHEPTVWCPGFSRFGPPEGGTPNKSCHTVRFRVPMHGKKAEEAFHEPEGRARQSPARRLCIAKLRRARSDAPYRFMVPMHAEKIRKRAFHEPSGYRIAAGFRKRR